MRVAAREDRVPRGKVKLNEVAVRHRTVVIVTAHVLRARAGAAVRIPVRAGPRAFIRGAQAGLVVRSEALEVIAAEGAWG